MNYQAAVAGGIAAMTGAAASHPLDVIKVRMQIEKKASVWPTVKKVVEERSFFNGLSASLLRQAVYSSARFGIYDALKGGGKEPTFAYKVAYGLISGGVGAIIANPFDLTLVRMQADAKLPVAERRNYANVFDGVLRILRTEGVAALWKGFEPTCLRAMVITASQFAVYDQVKSIVVKREILREGTGAHLFSAFAAGTFASLTSNPFDVVKTRVYNAQPGQFKTPVDCFVQIIKHEGPLALFKGLVPTFVRQAPYVIVMFLTLEKVNAGFKYLNNKKKEQQVTV